MKYLDKTITDEIGDDDDTHGHGVDGDGVGARSDG